MSETFTKQELLFFYINSVINADSYQNHVSVFLLQGHSYWAINEA